MVGGIHAGVQWKSTFPLTVIGGVALRGDDPVLWVGKGVTINSSFQDLLLSQEDLRLCALILSVTLSALSR